LIAHRQVPIGCTLKLYGLVSEIFSSKVATMIIRNHVMSDVKRPGSTIGEDHIDTPYREIWVPVNSSHGQLVTQSPRHTVNSSQSIRHTVNSSQRSTCHTSQLVTVNSSPRVDCDDHKVQFSYNYNSKNLIVYEIISSH